MWWSRDQAWCDHWCPTLICGVSPAHWSWSSENISSCHCWAKIFSNTTFLDHKGTFLTSCEHQNQIRSEYLYLVGYNLNGCVTVERNLNKHELVRVWSLVLGHQCSHWVSLCPGHSDHQQWRTDAAWHTVSRSRTPCNQHSRPNTVPRILTNHSAAFSQLSWCWPMRAQLSVLMR